MSRRASLLAKQNKCKPKVRFPDELVFLDNIKENDLIAATAMLRRASLQMDINGLNDAGLTPMHQAVLDGNLRAVRLLVKNGADVNRKDADSWTPLHAACSEGHPDIVRYLLKHGADRSIKTREGERPLDLAEPTDFATISAMLESDAARESKIIETDDELEKDEGNDDDDDKADDEKADDET